MVPANYADTLVLRALRDGDEQALEHLFSTFYNRLFRTALKICPDSELAKECIQHVFNELWQYRATIGEIESFEAYLKTAIKRRVFKEISHREKQKAGENASFLEQPIEVPSWEEILIEQQSKQFERQKLHELLDQLSPRQKEIVVLKYFEEMTYPEIAARTGLQTDTIYKVLHEAVKKLKSLAV